MLNTFRARLLVGVLLGFIIPYALAMLYIHNYLENWVMTFGVDRNKLILCEISNRVDDKFIMRMKEQVETLGNDECLHNVEESMSNYLSSSFSENNDGSSLIGNSIRDYFETIISTNRNIKSIFFSMENGGYIEYSAFESTSSYNSRPERLYKQSSGNEDVVISLPHMSSVTNEKIISFTISVYDGQAFLGVVGISMGLDQMKEIINEIQIGRPGYVIVQDENNNVMS